MLKLNLSPTHKYELVLHDTVSGVDGGIALVLRTEQKCRDVELLVSPFFQGPKGDTGSGDFQLEAGEALNANTPVVVVDGKVYKASNLNPQHAGQVFGISSGAALAGASVKIVVLGILENLSWSLTTGPVFLGHNAFTQTAPASGFIQILGSAMSATKLYVNLQQPFLR